MKVKRALRHSFRASYLSLAMMLLLFVAAAGCSSHVSKEKSKFLGVVLKCSSNPYFTEIEEGIRETAENFGVKVAVLVPDQKDPAEQPRLLEKLINLKVSALLIIPEEKNNCIAPIAKANSLKIPVIILDTGIDEALSKKIGAHADCLITSNNEKGGQLAGEYIAKRINGRGYVLMLEGKRDSMTGVKRKSGCISALSNYSSIRTLTSPPGEFNRTRAFEITKDYLKEHPEINGVFAFNDLMALGVSDAMAVNKIKNLVIVGYDATEEGIKAVKEGRIDATITQSPYTIGKSGVESALKLLNGVKVEQRIYTNTELVNREKLQLPFQ